jgi:hypothetical protein
MLEETKRRYMNLPEVKAKTKVVDRREESASRMKRAKEYDSVSDRFAEFAHR